MIKRSSIVTLLLALVAIPLSSPAQTTTVTNGLNWLTSTQTIDGNWPGVTTEGFVATATATDALFLLNPASSDYSQGLQWLEDRPESPTDLLARRIITLARSGRATMSEVAALLSLRDSSGSWSGEDGYFNNLIDTALALQALQASGYNDTSIIGPSLTYLTLAQKSDGAWGFTKNGVPNTYVTALLVNTMSLFRDSYAVQGALDKGVAYLLTKQTPDGGFGSSPSTVFETALAVEALTAAGELDSLRTASGLRGLGYLTVAQQSDGSWQSDPYNTALAFGGAVL